MLLDRLIARGYTVELILGRLVLKSSSGTLAPADWQNDRQLEIIEPIAELLNIPVFQYLGFNTGLFAGGRFSGVKLEYINLVDKSYPYACFNAGIKHLRNTAKFKAGTPYKGKKFNVGERSAFKAFWLKMGLSLPQNNSKYHECMGKLKPIFVTAELGANNKLKNGSIEPVNISSEVVRDLVNGRVTTNSLPKNHQSSTNYLLSGATKETLESSMSKGLESDCNYGELNYGSSIKGERVKDICNVLTNTNTDNNEHSHDDWLSDYGKVDFEPY